MPEIISLHEKLKSETAENHNVAEQRLTPYISGLNSRNAYIRLLKAFHGFYNPAFSVISRYINNRQLPDISQRNTSSFIEHDLAALSFTGPIQYCEDLPSINDTASALGALYVLEGSTLGGKYIKNMLLSNKSLNLTEEHTRFFNSYGPHTGSKWKSFLNVINLQEDHFKIIRTANETFERFGFWMHNSLHDE